MNTTLRLLSPLLALGTTLIAADQKPAPYRPAPVSVSSANYAETPRDQLLTLTSTPHQVNPETRTVQPRTRTERFVFMPGELYDSDIGFEEICQRLTPVLAKKGFINATDDQGRVIDPKNVDLILRVHSGERDWRVPTVRTDQLTWNDGLASRPRGRSLTTLGGDVMWENRAGGNDEAFAANATNENRPGFGYGSSAPTPAGTSPLTSGSAYAQAQANSANAEYEATREFYLLVVDAYSYNDLMKKGKNAKRLWTTFVAAPRQPGQKYSDVLATMLRVATPYFGETTSGLQMFNDARATVEIGPTKVIEADVRTPDAK